MHEYMCKFIGLRKGDTGCCQNYCALVRSEDGLHYTIRNALYETFAHIESLNITPLEGPRNSSEIDIYMTIIPNDSFYYKGIEK